MPGSFLPPPYKQDSMAKQTGPRCGRPSSAQDLPGQGKLPAGPQATTSPRSASLSLSPHWCLGRSSIAKNILAPERLLPYSLLLPFTLHPSVLPKTSSTLHSGPSQGTQYFRRVHKCPAWDRQVSTKCASPSVRPDPQQPSRSLTSDTSSWPLWR